MEMEKWNVLGGFSSFRGGVIISYNTRLNHQSERNTHNLSKNGVTTIFQSAIWTVWVLCFQP